MANLKKLIGLNIDTFHYSWHPVKDGEEGLVFNTLNRLGYLPIIRRINGSNTFSSYTRHLKRENLGETLEAFLND